MTEKRRSIVRVKFKVPGSFPTLDSYETEYLDTDDIQAVKKLFGDRKIVCNGFILNVSHIKELELIEPLSLETFENERGRRRAQGGDDGSA